MLVSDGGAGNVVYHLYGNSHLGQQVQGSFQFQTFITDGLGSVRVEMETSGRTNYVRTFSPFGETLDETGNRSSVYGYTPALALSSGLRMVLWSASGRTAFSINRLKSPHGSHKNS